MTPEPLEDRKPLVSVILSTRDRPRLLALALDYYRYQSYSRRELIVVDVRRIIVIPISPAQYTIIQTALHY